MMKLIFSIVLMLLPFLATAQESSRRISIIPHAGATFSRIDGDAIVIDTKWKTGFVAGAEFEIPVARTLSITAGADYSLIGTGLKGGIALSGNDYKAYGKYKNINVSYISIPVQAKKYIGSGFAVHAGVEVGFKVSAKMNMEEDGIRTMRVTEQKHSPYLWENYTEKYDEDEWDNFRIAVIDIPIGISYEYKDFILNASYRFEVLTGMHMAPQDTPYADNSKTLSARNHAILVTLGYRLRL